MANCLGKSCSFGLLRVHGSDGGEDSVYKVRYDGDDETYEIVNLSEDLRSCQIKFIDI